MWHMRYSVAVALLVLLAALPLHASDGDSPPLAPPGALVAWAVDANHIDVSFAQPLDPATAQDPARYTMAPALTIVNAALDRDGKTVHLTTATMCPGIAYTVFVDSVADATGRPASDGGAVPVVGASARIVTAAVAGAPQVTGATYLDATHVFVSFDRKMDPVTSQRAANYVIAPSVPVTAAVLGSGGAMVRLTTGVQTPGVKYTVTVSNVKGANGKLISPTARTATWTVPTTVPQVIAVSPTGSSVGLLSQVTITFNMPMDVPSAHLAFSISPPTGGNLGWSGNTLLFVPGGLEPGVIYTVTEDTSAMSTAGVHMAAPYSWSFSTAASSHIKVACCGDSITQNTEYPVDLEGLLGAGHNVVNFGHGGAAVQRDSGRPYMDMPEFTSAQQYLPDTVIIMLGTNDTWIPDYHLTYFVADYTTIAQTFVGLSSQPQVFLVIPPPIYPNTAGLSNTNLVQGVIPLIRQVATSLGLPLVDAYTPLSGHPELFPDGIHPNSQGAAILANTIYHALTGG